MAILWHQFKKKIVNISNSLTPWSNFLPSPPASPSSWRHFQITQTCLFPDSNPTLFSPVTHSIVLSREICGGRRRRRGVYLWGVRVHKPGSDRRGGFVSLTFPSWKFQWAWWKSKEELESDKSFHERKTLTTPPLEVKNPRYTLTSIRLVYKWVRDRTRKRRIWSNEIKTT